MKIINSIIIISLCILTLGCTDKLIPDKDIQVVNIYEYGDWNNIDSVPLYKQITDKQVIKKFNSMFVDINKGSLIKMMSRYHVQFVYPDTIINVYVSGQFFAIPISNESPKRRYHYTSHDLSKFIEEL